jgi:hypothetical protein
MSEITPEIENMITQLSSEEFNDLVSRTRPAIDSQDKQVRAAAALRDYRHGALPDRRGSGRSDGSKYSKEEAAAYIRGEGFTFEGDD